MEKWPRPTGDPEKIKAVEEWVDKRIEEKKQQDAELQAGLTDEIGRERDNLIPPAQAGKQAGELLYFGVIAPRRAGKPSGEHSGSDPDDTPPAA